MPETYEAYCKSVFKLKIELKTEVIYLENGFKKHAGAVIINLAS